MPAARVPVPEQDLPVVLPEDLVPDGTGNPLNKCEAFLNVACPRCAKPARRETDTMDTFVDSAWYYMRYCCPDSDGAMVDARNDYWMPMDQYIGGIEHAVLHLLYARFWTKAMRDLGLVKFDEPFTRLFTQGMLLNDCFYRDDAAGKRRWFYPSEVDIRYDDKGHPVGATAREDGQPVLLGGIEKMSKSKNNVVEPKDIIARFGADTARVFTMFAAPPDQSAAWSDSGAEGAFRFLRRLWAFAERHAGRIRAAGDDVAAAGAAQELRREVHSLLRQISHDYDRLQYNTVVSGAMKLLNALDAAAADAPGIDAALREGLGVLLRALYPAAPHITHALWSALGYAERLGDLLDAPWPEVDEAALVQDRIELVLQVNGKLRGAIIVPASADKAAIEAAAIASPDFTRFSRGQAGAQDHRRAGSPGQRGGLGPADDAASQRSHSPRPRWLPAAASSCGARPSCPSGASRSWASSRARRSARTCGERSTTCSWWRTPARADVVLEALEDERQRVVVASTAGGQVRELQLRTRLVFRLSTPKGRSLIPPTELLLTRDMSYTETLGPGQGAGGGGAVSRDAGRHRRAGDAAPGRGGLVSHADPA